MKKLYILLAAALMTSGVAAMEDRLQQGPNKIGPMNKINDAIMYMRSFFPDIYMRHLNLLICRDK